MESQRKSKGFSLPQGHHCKRYARLLPSESLYGLSAALHSSHARAQSLYASLYGLHAGLHSLRASPHAWHACLHGLHARWYGLYACMDAWHTCPHGLHPGFHSLHARSARSPDYGLRGNQRLMLNKTSLV